MAVYNGLEVDPNDPYTTEDDARRNFALENAEYNETLTGGRSAGNFTPPQVTPPEDATPGERTPSGADSPLQRTADQVAMDMMSGDWTQGLTTQMNETTARGIANLRANTAQQAAAAGIADQGAGQQAMQAVEQFAVQENSRNALMAEIAGQEAKERGAALATQRGYLDIAYKNQAVNTAFREVQALVNMGGEENFAAAAETWKETFGYDVNFDRFSDIQAMDDYFQSAGNLAQMIDLQQGFDSPDVQAELTKMWKYQRNEGPMDPTWARNTFDGVATAGNEFDYTMAQIYSSDFLAENPDIRNDVVDMIVAGWDGEALGLNFVTGWEVTDAAGNVVAAFDDQASANAFVNEQDDPTQFSVANNPNNKRLTFLDPATGNTFGGFGTYRGGPAANDPALVQDFVNNLSNDWEIETDASTAQQFMSDMGIGAGQLNSVTPQQWNDWDRANEDAEHAIGLLEGDPVFGAEDASSGTNNMLEALLQDDPFSGIPADERDAKAQEYGFSSYAQYNRVKGQVRVSSADWGGGDWGLDDNGNAQLPSLSTVSEKFGPTGRGVMSLAAQFDNSVYSAPEQKSADDTPGYIQFNTTMSDWIDENKGSVITLDMGDGNGATRYYIDPENPITTKSYGTYTNNGYEYKKDALHVFDVESGEWKDIEWAGAWRYKELRNDAEAFGNETYYTGSGVYHGFNDEDYDPREKRVWGP